MRQHTLLAPSNRQIDATYYLCCIESCLLNPGNTGSCSKAVILPMAQMEKEAFLRGISWWNLGPSRAPGMAIKVVVGRERLRDIFSSLFAYSMCLPSTASVYIVVT